MAYFQYLSEIESDCLFSSFQKTLEEIGLRVSDEFSSHAQIFAEESISNVNYQAKVKVIISWSNKTLRQCSIEVRSDEPYLKRDTCCERLANQLRTIIPPRNESQQLKPL